MTVGLRVVVCAGLEVALVMSYSLIFPSLFASFLSDASGFEIPSLLLRFFLRLSVKICAAKRRTTAKGEAAANILPTSSAWL